MKDDESGDELEGLLDHGSNSPRASSDSDNNGESSSSATPLQRPSPRRKHSPQASSRRRGVAMEPVVEEEHLTKLGRFRAYWLGTVCCIGGFLFGYDTGIVGGVLTLASFSDSFEYGTSDETRVQSLCVGLQQAGAFAACFIVWPMTNKLGRKKAIMISSAVFCIGTIIQTIDTHSIGAFYAGRIIAGCGLGASSVVIPMFNSEMSPKSLRGKIGSFYQLLFTFGIFASYLVDYGVAKGLTGGATQWQIPVGLQLVPGALLGLAMLTIPESTRWLTRHGHHDEAWESLRWIRADESIQVKTEMQEIREGVALEAQITQGFHIKELLEGDNFKRIFAAFVIFCAQQSTGATAFAYFGPQYFKLLVGGGDKDLLLTAIFGVVKILACLTFVVFLAERVGRRQVLIGGALFMAACQITTAVVVKELPPRGGDNPTVTGAGIATIALIYLFVGAYNFSWGPLPWPYVSEIFPTRIREVGMAVGVSSQWLFNFVYSLTTPYMIKDMGWGTFLLWGIFDFVIAAGTFMFLRETKGYSLEEIAQDKFARGAESHHRPIGKTGDIDDPPEVTIDDDHKGYRE